MPWLLLVRYSTSHGNKSSHETPTRCGSRGQGEFTKCTLYVFGLHLGPWALGRGSRLVCPCKDDEGYSPPSSIFAMPQDLFQNFNNDSPFSTFGLVKFTRHKFEKCWNIYKPNKSKKKKRVNSSWVLFDRTRGRPLFYHDGIKGCSCPNSIDASSCASFLMENLVDEERDQCPLFL